MLHTQMLPRQTHLLKNRQAEQHHCLSILHHGAVAPAAGLMLMPKLKLSLVSLP